MEIKWYGHSCFRLSERGLATIVTDPFDHKVVGYSPLKIKADIVTISHDAPGHNYLKGVKGASPKVVSGPGEYEIGGVFITAVQTNGKQRKAGEPRNILYVFDFEGVTVAHLGDLQRVPSQSEIEALGTVNVALVPVSNDKFNAAKAAEVVSLIEPGVVIPMHFATPDTTLKLDPLGKFLKEMGVSQDIPPESKFNIRASNIPGETRIVRLAY